MWRRSPNASAAESPYEANTPRTDRRTDHACTRGPIPSSPRASRASPAFGGLRGQLRYPSLATTLIAVSHRGEGVDRPRVSAEVVSRLDECAVVAGQVCARTSVASLLEPPPAMEPTTVDRILLQHPVQLRVRLASRVVRGRSNRVDEPGVVGHRIVLRPPRPGRSRRGVANPSRTAEG